MFLGHYVQRMIACDFFTVETAWLRTLYVFFFAPKANAFAERWIRSVREEVLDRILVLNEAHLWRVMLEYIEYYNRARPHQGLEQRCPLPIDRARAAGQVKCRDLLGGIVHDHYRDAA